MRGPDLDPQAGAGESEFDLSQLRIVVTNWRALSIIDPEKGQASTEGPVRTDVPDICVGRKVTADGLAIVLEDALSIPIEQVLAARRMLEKHAAPIAADAAAVLAAIYQETRQLFGGHVQTMQLPVCRVLDDRPLRPS